MKSVMFDTNVFDRVVKNSIKEIDLQKYKIFLTSIQIHELQAYTKTNTYLQNLQYNWVSSCAIFSISRYGDRYDNSIRKEIFNKMEEKKKHKNNAKDSSIIESAVENKLSICTFDNTMREVAEEYKIEIIIL